MVRLADYVIDTLYKNYVEHIFMVTGRGALFLTDAVSAHKQVDGVSVHHEQSAGYAAVSYAQVNNKLGACLVSTGCASTNAITAVLNAWQDGIPCVFISGQNKLAETTYHTGLPIRTYGQQEANIIPLVESITKYSIMITDPKKIVYELEKAIHLAQSGRKGPVWIDIPLDVQNMRVDLDTAEHYLPENIEEFTPLKKDIEFITNKLNEASRPVVLVGSAIVSSTAEKQLKEFLETNQIPLVYSPSAGDAYGSENELSIGSVGVMGCSRAGNFAIQNSDLVLVLGNRLNSMVVGEKCQFAREAKVIVVDIDEVEHSKEAVDIDKLVIADVKKVLVSLLDTKIKKTETPWLEKCKHWKKIFPKCEEGFRNDEKVDLYHLSQDLSKVLPEQSTVITDSGLIELILPANISFKEGQKCIHPLSQGAMGVVLPAIIGAHFSNNNPVIAVVGDGSIMMNIQELITISYKKIPAKIFVVNNNAYAVIRKRQKELFRNRTIGNDPSDGVGMPEFENLANTFNLSYLRIETSDNLEGKLQKVIDMNGPVLCEIMGLVDQSFIGSGHARNSKGRIVTRPIEDQKPYLDRELFLSEMIIKAIHQ
jgi:acetolactate synthase-1/2/3 large subunit